LLVAWEGDDGGRDGFDGEFRVRFKHENGFSQSRVVDFGGDVVESSKKKKKKSFCQKNQTCQTTRQAEDT
jgi:hypothetical protein